jgi:hypothetical protein
LLQTPISATEEKNRNLSPAAAAGAPTDRMISASAVASVASIDES